MKHAIVLITFKPRDDIIAFYNSFNDYDVFVVIDDETLTYPNTDFSNVQYVQVSSKECKLKGICNTSNITLDKEVSGWDKALYYMIYTSKVLYDHIWFIEDDVFMKNEKTLLNIDEKYKYKHKDILCNSSFAPGNLQEWHWNKIQIEYEPPYYCGMMCICRMSQCMIRCIQSYAEQHQTLFFLEALFPTLAIKNGVNVIFSPEEFTSVVYRQDWKPEEIEDHKLYHPIKTDHNTFRNAIKD